jgi:hypothetical protein
MTKDLRGAYVAILLSATFVFQATKTPVSERALCSEPTTARLVTRHKSRYLPDFPQVEWVILAPGFKT